MNGKTNAPLRAAIDIGSNSVRLALSDGTVKSVITKLADGIETSGRLSPDGVTATVAALARFADECKDCARVDAFATEAVRRAADGAEFCAAVKAATGLTVTVISPEEEARLALVGATKPSGAVTVCDLGGGSMELICSADGKTVEYAQSRPLGVVVLKNKYRGDYRRLTDDMPELLKSYGSVARYTPVLSGGSACAIAAALLNLAVYDKTKIDGAHFTAQRLDDFMPVLLSPKLATLRPVCARRADTVPYGAIVLRALIGYVGATDFYVSDSGNLQAVLKGD